MRRSLVELNATLAGAMLETSFAIFKISTAAFSEERTPSRPFGRWALSVIVQMEKAMRGGGCEEPGLSYVWTR